jgi:hypothetical protein
MPHPTFRRDLQSFNSFGSPKFSRLRQNGRSSVQAPSGRSGNSPVRLWKGFLMCPATRRCDRPSPRYLVAIITSLWSSSILARGKINIRNIRRTPRIDKHLILVTPVEDIGEHVSKTIHKFWGHKNWSSILGSCKFWWSEIVSLATIETDSIRDLLWAPHTIFFRVYKY